MRETISNSTAEPSGGDRVTLQERSLYTDRLIVQHNLHPPRKIDNSFPSHHLIALHLTPSPHRIARIGDRYYEGLYDVGTFCLHPTIYPGSYAWSTIDKTIVFAVKPEYLTRIATQTECLNPDRLELRPVVIDRDPNIECIARSFLKEMQNKGLGGKLYNETLGVQLAIELLRNYSVIPAKLKQYQGGLSPRQLKAVIDYIDACLEGNISLKDLAKISQIDSDYYFSHLFKQSTGISPYQYVIQQRVKRAKQLLKQDLPLIEIAIMCGFCDQSAFSRTFRKCVGTTPSNYRKQL